MRCVGLQTQRIAGNAAADAYAKEAAEQGAPDKDSRLASERIIASLLKRRAAGKTACQ